METLVINNFPTILWVMLSLIMIAGMFAFLKFYLIPEWQQKKIKQYEQYIKLLQSDIDTANEQWEMETLAYLIYGVNKTYKGEIELKRIRNDVNELVDRWHKRDFEMTIPKEFSKS